MANVIKNENRIKPPFASTISAELLLNNQLRCISEKSIKFFPRYIRLQKMSQANLNLSITVSVRIVFFLTHSNEQLLTYNGRNEIISAMLNENKKLYALINRDW